MRWIQFDSRCRRAIFVIIMVRMYSKLFVVVDLQLAIGDSERMIKVVTYHFLNCHNCAGDRFRVLLNLCPAKTRKIFS